MKLGIQWYHQWMTQAGTHMQMGIGLLTPDRCLRIGLFQLESISYSTYTQESLEAHIGSHHGPLEFGQQRSGSALGGSSGFRPEQFETGIHQRTGGTELQTIGRAQLGCVNLDGLRERLLPGTIWTSEERHNLIRVSLNLRLHGRWHIQPTRQGSRHGCIQYSVSALNCLL